MDYVPMPDWVQENSHADGTASVLPGYTPGRDVHSFYSPTAGRLNLSGGEAIMRPEFTAAVGKQGIDYWNNISKRGVGAVRNAMRGNAFASGGIFWPVPGRETGTYPGHDGVDINRGSGWDDYGDPIVAAHTGKVSYVGTAHGYGDAIWINGTDGYTTLYGHTSMQFVHAGQPVNGGQLIGRVGNTGHSSAPHLHFGVYPGGTFEAALGYLQGALPGPGPDGGGGGGGWHLPGWAGDILSGPADWLKGKITAPIQSLTDKFGDNAWGGLITHVPEKLVGAVGGSIKDMVSDAGHSIGHAIGGALDTIGLKDGGILPYNGTMKYDSGGFLPPGLTSVVNMTGKPEPVFTANQFADMNGGKGGDGGFSYSPTFVGTDLTAADVVDDLDFARRKIQREGRYGRSHN
jgi:murein DD-endopeptidase MepM/ murein hydrolase activator NlpD